MPAPSVTGSIFCLVLTQLSIDGSYIKAENNVCVAACCVPQPSGGAPFFFCFFLTSLKFDVASVGSITFFKLQPLKKKFFLLKICISFGNCETDKYSHLNHLAVFLGVAQLLCGASACK